MTDTVVAPKRGRPKSTGEAPPTPKRDVDSELRLEKARMLVVRGTPRATIIRKLKLTPGEVTSLNAWRRA